MGFDVSFKLKIAGRLALGFFGILGLVGLVIGYATLQIGSANHDTEIVRDVRAPAAYAESQALSGDNRQRQCLARLHHYSRSRFTRAMGGKMGAD